MARARIALVLVTLAAALLLPSPAAAQSSPCQIQDSWFPFTRPLLNYWTPERQVVVEGRTLTLVFCAPKSQSIVADQMLELAVEALPVLDSLTDVQLDGSHRRVFYLDGDGLLERLGADGAIDPDNRIFLSRGSLESTVVHELAHYWSDQDRFGELWMVEAYAQHLANLAMPLLNRTPNQFPVYEACASVRLDLWRREPRATESCAYSLGPWVLQELAARAGEDNLRRVIGELSRRPGGVSSVELLIELERVSGANLSLVMRDHVFAPGLHDELTARAAVRERLSATAALAAELGMAVPPSVAASLDERRHADAGAILDQVAPVVESAAATRRRCTELDLPCERPWEGLGADLAALAGVSARLGLAPQILSDYEQLRAEAAALGAAVPEAVRRHAGALSEQGHAELRGAAGVLASARALEARCAELGLSCRDSWRPEWERGELEALTAKIAGLGATFDAGVAVEGRCGDLAARCREIWMRALAGGPTRAQEAVGELDGLLAAGAAVEERCGDLAASCGELWRSALLGGAAADARAVVGELEALLADGEALAGRCGDLAASCDRLWQAGLGQGSIEAARQSLDGLAALVGRAEKFEASCGDNWNCGDAWRAALAAGDPARAAAVLDAQEQALPELQAAELAADSIWSLGPIRDGSAMAGAEPLAEAQAAFARGEVAEALALARAARERQLWAERALLVAAALAGAAALAALLLVAMRRRRPRTAPAALAAPAAPAGGAGRAGGGDLLAQLLDSPPEEPGR